MINLRCACNAMKMNHLNGNGFLHSILITEEDERKLRNVGTYLYSGWKQ